MKGIISAAEAAALVRDGQTLATTGFLGFCVPEDILDHLEQRCVETGHPKDLTVFHAAGIGGDGVRRGANHWGTPGLVKKLLCANTSATPKAAKAIADERFAAFMAPQGVLSHMMRAIAAGEPGVLTHVGLGTFCDPRLDGCRMNQKAWDSGEEVVELLKIRGEDCLLYHTFPIDVCLIKATSADEGGNISWEHEALHIEQYEMAAATRNSGGTVIVQVDRIVQRGSLRASQVIIPATMVDYVVVGAPENSRQHYMSGLPDYVAAWTGEVKIPLDSLPPIPLDLRKVCGRRGVMELERGDLVNLGIGMPDTVASVANEEEVFDRFDLTIESGAIGGVPAAGMATGAAYNAEAILKQPDFFDFYDGGGIDVAYLGLAQADRRGNVNVSRFAGRVTGPGGFIDITQNAKKVCFMGSFTAGKTELRVGDGKLDIVTDSDGVKFVEQVEHVTFSADYAMKHGHTVLYITERAVFRLTPGGVMLTEIAPGVDPEKDILGKMAFRPLIAEDLKEMDPRIFTEGKMGLK